MELSLINIGNSKGIKLPKKILEKYNIVDKVELIFEQDQIILKPKTKPRKDWEKAFKKMHQNNDDLLLIDDFLENEDFDKIIQE